MLQIYGPYTELDYVFDDRNARDLVAAMEPGDRTRLPFDTGTFDWTDYPEGSHLLRIHRMAEERDGSSPQSRPVAETPA